MPLTGGLATVSNQVFAGAQLTSTVTERSPYFVRESITFMNYLRRLPKFEYLATRSIDEACDLLAAHGNEVRLLAGGTDLLLQMRRREACPAYIIGLKGITELSGVRTLADGGLAIGAMTTIQALMSSPVVREKYGVLAEAAAGIGGPERRNVATIGGNLAGALPCADIPPL